MTEHQSWFDIVPVYVEDPLETAPACGEPSPSGVMLCDLPATTIRHHMTQHMGVDKHGNFRGWPDKRGTTL